MSDVPPEPPSDAPPPEPSGPADQVEPPSEAPSPEAPPPEAPPPVPPAPATTTPYITMRGVVPPDLTGVYYNVGLTILLVIVTCGIWSFLWVYRTSEDLKKYNGDGLGGVFAVIIQLLLSIILMFTIPNEVKNAYEREGRESPVSAIWGLWFLLPIIGHIIWYVKVQHALNDFWRSKGAVG